MDPAIKEGRKLLERLLRNPGARAHRLHLGRKEAGQMLRVYHRHVLGLQSRNMQEPGSIL